MDESLPPESSQLLDCRGLVCPAPILEIAEVVRRQGIDLQTLVVLATDADFPEDVEAWCRSTGATLLRMDHLADGTIRARIRVKHAGSPASISAAPTAIAPGPARRRSSVSSSRTPGTGGASTAWTERSPGDGISAAALPREHRASLLVLHNDLEALLSALTIANASAAQGMKVEVYFSFWGIHLLRAERRGKRPSGDRPSLLQRILLWLVPRGTRQPLGKLHLGGLGTRLVLRLMRKRNMLALGQLLQAAGSLGVRLRVCSASMSLMGLCEEDILAAPNVDFVGAATFAEAAARSAINLVF